MLVAGGMPDTVAVPGSQDQTADPDLVGPGGGRSQNHTGWGRSQGAETPLDTALRLNRPDTNPGSHSGRACMRFSRGRRKKRGHQGKLRKAWPWRVVLTLSR